MTYVCIDNDFHDSEEGGAALAGLITQLTRVPQRINEPEAQRLARELLDAFITGIDDATARRNYPTEAQEQALNAFTNATFGRDCKRSLVLTSLSVSLWFTSPTGPVHVRLRRIGTPSVSVFAQSIAHEDAMRFIEKARTIPNSRPGDIHRARSLAHLRRDISQEMGSAAFC